MKALNLETKAYYHTIKQYYESIEGHTDYI